MTRPSKSSLVLDGNVIKYRLEAERLETKSMVHVDWLRFSTRLRFAPAFLTDVQPTTTSIWDQGARLPELLRIINSLPDCDRSPAGQAADLADRVCTLLGVDYARASMLGKGHDFYKHRWPILRNGQEVGWVGFLASSDSPKQQGQADSLHVNLFGSACTFADQGWQTRFADLVDELNADITRCDLAVDFFDGYTGGIERVVDDYKAGLCNVAGRKPKVRDINFIKGRERSLYIGSKDAGKETNVYEKGHQLYGEESATEWLRFELRYGNKVRVISSDILRRPGDFFAGASEWHASVLQEAGQVASPEFIERIPRLALMTVEAECERNLRWQLTTAAASISIAFKHLGLDEFLALVSSVDLPGRLRSFKQSELLAGFASAAKRLLVSESCPVPA